MAADARASRHRVNRLRRPRTGLYGASLILQERRDVAAPKTKKTVFSGVQPTGDLHIGNLIGALSLWVREQERHDNIFCVVDLHALTIPEAIEAKALHKSSLDVAALYVACGIDPDKS